jgi:hypothetical protein
MVNQVQARRWLYLWIVAAAIYAVPVGKIAYDRTIEVTRKHRVQLIVAHRLWELHPEYNGRPETWTNFASRLLTDRQLLLRVRAKYREDAEPIELDYRRDLSIAQGEVIVVALAIWGLPIGLAYGLGRALAARRRKPPPAPLPPRAAYDESRYRPPS